MSHVNPIERVMSLLNLGVQRLALARALCRVETKAVLRGAGGLRAIRSALIEAEGNSAAEPNSHTHAHGKSMHAPSVRLELAYHTSTIRSV
jgi:hypothetical protein